MNGASVALPEARGDPESGRNRMFWLRFCRLLGSVALEALTTVVHLGMFPWTRSRQRERIRTMMLKQAARNLLGVRPRSVVDPSFCAGTRSGRRSVPDVRRTPARVFGIRSTSFSGASKSSRTKPCSAIPRASGTTSRCSRDPEFDQLPESIELLGWWKRAVRIRSEEFTDGAATQKRSRNMASSDR